MKIGRIALAGLATVSLAALVGPFLVPVPPLRGTHPAQALADADSQFIELNGLSVHIKIWDQGEPVFVLMHGFGASLYTWQASCPMHAWRSLETLATHRTRKALRLSWTRFAIF